MQNLVRKIRRTSTALTQQFNHFGQRFGLTEAQMSVIDYISRLKYQSCNQQMIEREFEIKRSTTTVIIQRLAKKNLIVQKPSPTDGRQKLIELTSGGKKLVPDIRNYIDSQEQRIRAHFSTEEIQIVETFLNYLAKGETTDGK